MFTLCVLHLCCQQFEQHELTQSHLTSYQTVTAPLLCVHCLLFITYRYVDSHIADRSERMNELTLFTWVAVRCCCSCSVYAAVSTSEAAV